MIKSQWLKTNLIRKVNPIQIAKASTTRTLSSASKPPSDDFETLLAKPSWSVKSLFTSPKDTASGSTPQITQRQLHHLLRLSALPLPTSPAQESRMIADLQSQLQFVRAIQEVDTDGVEPLFALRDETEEGVTEGTIGLEEMRGELEKAEVVGMRGRIVRRKSAEGNGEGGKEKGGDLDLLAQAPKRLGPYVVVDTMKD